MAPESPAGRRDRRVPDRAQTGFDFLVGMSVFLVAVGLVLGFVPGLFLPFDTDTGPDMVTADRSAARLVEDLLVSDVTEPSVLNDTCTGEFFDANGDTADCRFDADGSDLHAALDVDQFTDLNVTVESEGTIQTLPGPVTLSLGDAPPSTADVVAAKRVVLLDGQHMTLLVRVW